MSSQRALERRVLECTCGKFLRTDIVTRQPAPMSDDEHEQTRVLSVPGADIPLTDDDEDERTQLLRSPPSLTRAKRPNVPPKAVPSYRPAAPSSVRRSVSTPPRAPAKTLGSTAATGSVFQPSRAAERSERTLQGLGSFDRAVPTLEFAPGVEAAPASSPVSAKRQELSAPQPKKLEIGPADPTVVSVRGQSSAPAAQQNLHALPSSPSRAQSGFAQAIVRGLVLGAMVLFCGVLGYFLFAQRGPAAENQTPPVAVAKPALESAPKSEKRPLETDESAVKVGDLPVVNPTTPAPTEPASTGTKRSVPSRRSFAMSAKRAALAQRDETLEATESNSGMPSNAYEENRAEPKPSEEPGTSIKDSINDPGF
jgi:hypothetical protein